jgi:hypothetical protein
VKVEPVLPKFTLSNHSLNNARYRQMCLHSTQISSLNFRIDRQCILMHIFFLRFLHPTFREALSLKDSLVFLSLPKTPHLPTCSAYQSLLRPIWSGGGGERRANNHPPKRRPSQPSSDCTDAGEVTAGSFRSFACDNNSASEVSSTL